MSRIYRAAVVGLGRVGASYEAAPGAPPRTHVEAYLAHPRINLTAAADPDESRRVAFIERFGFQGPVYESAAEMADHQALDLVSVCVPARDTADVVAEVLAGAPRAFLLEKPMAVDEHGARRLGRLLNAAQIPAAVNYPRSWDPAHELFFERMARAGRPLTARALYGRGLYNNASHLVALLHRHFGPGKRVSAWNPDQPGESPDPSLSFSLELERGFTAHFQGLDGTDFDLFDLEFILAGGVHSLLAGGCRRREARAVKGLFYPGYAHLSPESPFVTDGPLAGLSGAVDNLVAVLDDPAVPLAFDWRMGLEVLAVLDAVRESHRAHGRPCDVTPIELD
ncbi:MAG: Gfo/Idh/MocA family oxidoreductase [Proteobacteria bacterium]|nr:Gfo/Idh/MocA family oxidoreductase [Pseudomonadota bacterium]